MKLSSNKKLIMMISFLFAASHGKINAKNSGTISVDNLCIRDSRDCSRIHQV